MSADANHQPPEAAATRSTAPPTAGQMRSFPLIALVQLATYLAAIVACINGGELAKNLDQAASQPLIAASIVLGACATVGMIGVIIGMSQLHMNRSALVGGAVGALYGLVILALYAAPAPIERSAAAAAMLLLTTIAFRIRAD